MSSLGFASEFEQVPIRGGGHILRPISTASADARALLNIPPDVIAAILATPKMNTVLGDHHVDDSIIRTENFMFGYQKTFTFDLGKNGRPFPPFLVIAAKNLFIITPDRSEIVSVITYENFLNLDGPDQPQRGADGVSWSPFHETGDHGGPGQAGPKGIIGGTAQLPLLYILFQNAFLSEQLPVTTEIISVQFRGIRGGMGGRAGRGGNGGRGATGTQSKCGGHPPHCQKGPGNGGNGGVAGQGGEGGDGGKGGDGGTVTVAAPLPMLQNYAGFFEYELTRGGGGNGGFPGPVGSYGTHGRAGFRCALCLRGAEHGHDGGYPNPTSLGQGSFGATGEDGTVSMFERDNSDLF